MTVASVTAANIEVLATDNSNAVVTAANIEVMSAENSTARVSTILLEVLSSQSLPIWNPTDYGPHQFVPSDTARVSTNMITVAGSLFNLSDGTNSPDGYGKIENRTEWGFDSYTTTRTYQQLNGGPPNDTPYQMRAFPNVEKPAHADDDTGVIGNLGCFIQWDFDTYTSIGWLLASFNTPFSLGMVQLQGSQDGFETYDNIGDPFRLNFTSSPGFQLGDPNVFIGTYFPQPSSLKDIPPNGVNYKTDTTRADGFDDVLPDVWKRSNGTGDPLYYVDTLFYKSFRIMGVDPFTPLITPQAYGKDYFSFYALMPMSSIYNDYVEQNPTDPLLIPPPAGKAQLPGPVTGPLDPTHQTPPYSDYDSVWSQGTRVALAASSSQKGNGLIVNTSVNSTDVSGGPADGFNNNFGSGAGDGPYFGSWPSGLAYEVEFDYPITLTAWKMFLPGTTGIRGAWQIWGSVDDGSGDFVQLSDTQAMTFAADPVTGQDTAEILVQYNFNPHFKYRIISPETGPGGRFATEIFFKVAHDAIAGGNRVTGHNIVDISGTLPIEADPTHSGSYTVQPTDGTGDYTTMIDGYYQYLNGGPSEPRLPARVVHTDGTPPFLTGHSLTFGFPNQVLMKRAKIQFASDFPVEVYVSDLPTLYGSWAWFGSNDGTTFTQVGHDFYWQVGTVEPLFDAGNTSEIFSYWKLEKTATIPAANSSGSYAVHQIVFDLEDTGPPTNGASFWVSREAPDTFAGVGIGIGVNGDWHSTEAPDRFSAASPVTGNWHSTEAKDTFLALAPGVTPPAPGKKRRIFFVT